MEDISLEDAKSHPFFQQIQKLNVTYQRFLDQSTPHVKYRWSGFAVLFLTFFTRIVTAQGWYIICYGLGIYLLNLFLAFLQPKFDPSIEQELQDDSIEAGEMTQEFKPFIRRLSEFKFWYRATVATSLSLFLSLFTITDVPVFWPILLMYFIILFSLTMRRQIQHMIKYKYLPFDIGKKKYGYK
ncbi:putative membrane protein [Wickerhamomyces ciferrii]|uniref:Protein RER1 n=1 Tax=Wickerhamomyces ciferrii (strain ATCC 14091 / BCRC 22168 / CBS 111 / JCM 3599 / NBRC 0793 / NRRL Y-1031 F-60-10) TaxID=1206466 RepID=K0KN68_WICCF|nr:uncharacterized protein BN7_2333 [Wickerhamomyces ciferrii]CCH42789.1 putative membrane protein [Wickerhamomyces ciferrii]